MPWERLEITLLPRMLIFARRSIAPWRRGTRPAGFEPIESASPGADWSAAVLALGKVLAREARPGARVNIALSDLWVRSHLMAVSARNLNEAEMLLLARGHFARQFPEAGQDSWTFRLARQGSCLLAAGMESALFQALAEVCARAGARLGRVEPIFGWVYDRSEKILANSTGWMLVDEPGLLCLAAVEKGQLMSLHCQRIEADQDLVALQLLERQSALLALSTTEVRVFSLVERLIRLPAPWRVVLQQKVVDFGDSASPAPATVAHPRQP